MSVWECEWGGALLAYDRPSGIRSGGGCGGCVDAGDAFAKQSNKILAALNVECVGIFAEEDCERVEMRLCNKKDGERLADLCVRLACGMCARRVSRQREGQPPQVFDGVDVEVVKAGANGILTCRRSVCNWSE